MYLDPNNVLLLTDGYKPSHLAQEMPGTTQKYYYLENRTNGLYPYSIFFGLQMIIKDNLMGSVITMDRILQADDFYLSYYGTRGIFPKDAWWRVMDENDGKLPIEIKAVPEGTKVPAGNVLFTVESTNKHLPDGFIAGWLEPLLVQCWYPTGVATRSHFTRSIIEEVGKITGDSGFDHHVHCFGFRGVTCPQAAMRAGPAHLLISKGSDTVSGAIGACNYYNADYTKIINSIPASEHSIMTQLGKEGEVKVLNHVLGAFPKCTQAFPIDSYNAVDMVTKVIPAMKEEIINRWEDTGRRASIVLRPDSPRCKGDRPEDQVLWLHNTLGTIFGTGVNKKGHTTLHPAVDVIYGDGLTTADIQDCYERLGEEGWSIDSFFVGQGGGLVQKISRDTMSTAYKLAETTINGVVHKVQKKPLDASKASKAGRMKLVKELYPDGTTQLTTYTDSHPLFNDVPDELKTVFLNGELMSDYKGDEVQARAKADFV